jgi:hypothetical protein
MPFRFDSPWELLQYSFTVINLQVFHPEEFIFVTVCIVACAKACGSNDNALGFMIYPC